MPKIKMVGPSAALFIYIQVNPTQVSDPTLNKLMREKTNYYEEQRYSQINYASIYYCKNQNQSCLKVFK